jgi:hypothetical protein
MTAAPPRVLGASAAAVVLVGLPLIITPAKPDKPAPVKGALTIELSGDHGASDPYRFVTTGPSPSPTARATLRDTSGEHTATASPQKSPCPSASRRVAFPELKGTDWCVQLERVSAGHELAGTVTSGANELALTVHRRDGFWLAPGLLHPHRRLRLRRPAQRPGHAHARDWRRRREGGTTGPAAPSDRHRPRCPAASATPRGRPHWAAARRHHCRGQGA